jgi:hypothetical protein
VRIRCRIADRLVKIAYRLDPQRPLVVVQQGGGWQIRVGQVPIANISDMAVMAR